MNYELISRGTRARALGLSVLGLSTLGLSLSGATTASADPFVYYTAESVQAGGAAVRALVPRVFDGAGSSAAERATAVFGQLKAARPQLYGAATLQLAGDFATGGGATLALDGLAAADLQTAIDEVWSSLALQGLHTLKVSARGEAALGRDAVSLPIFAPVISAWQALPPGTWEGASVRLDATNLVTVAEFRDRLARGDKAAQAAALAGLDAGAPLAGRVSVLGALKALGVADAAAIALPLLQDADPAVQVAAVGALADQKSDPRVAEALAKIVESEARPEVKTAAVKLLVAAGNRKYSDYLEIDKLADKDDGVVIAALRKLVASKNAGVAPALVAVLAHPTVDIRVEALNGIIALGNAEAMEQGLAAEGVQPDARERLAKALAGQQEPGAAARGLSWLVANGKPADAVAAAGALGERKAAAGVDALIGALGSPDADLRKAAVKALGAIGAAGAVEPLAALAGRSSGDEATLAGQAAVAILEAMSQDAVIERARSGAGGVAALAIRALAKFADDGRNAPVVITLKEQLRSTDAATRKAAAFALARVKDEGVANELLALKGDADPEVRAQVATAMGWAKNPAAGETLIALMGDADSEVKRAAAEGIGLQKVHAGLGVLIQYVQYGRPEVRRAVIGAVVAAAQPEDQEKVLEVYLNALYDQDTEVKLAAIRGMRPIRDQRVVTALSGAVIDPNVDVQKAAIDGLAETKDANATEGIARALFSDSRELKLLAIDALGRLGQDNVVKPLREFIKNEPDEELRRKASEVHDRF